MGVRMRKTAARTPSNSMKGARGLREAGIRTHKTDLNNHRQPAALVRERALEACTGRKEPLEESEMDTFDGPGSLTLAADEAETPVRRYRFSTGRTGKTRRKLWRKSELCNYICFCDLRRFRLAHWVLVVWLRPQNVSFVPSLFGTTSCQMVQVRMEWTLRPGSSI
jgi:hypothetical protein